MKECKVKGNEGLREQIGRKLESEQGGQSQAGGWVRVGGDSVAQPPEPWVQWEAALQNLTQPQWWLD